MIIKHLIVDVHSTEKELKDKLYAVIKYDPVKDILEIGGKQKNFEYINNITSMFVKSIDEEANISYYQRVKLRYTIKNIGYTEFKKKLEKIKKDEDLHVSEIDKITGLI